jgi:hypothetical protein
MLAPVGAHALAADPTREGTVFAGWEGVFRTTDSGATWERALAGVATVRAVAVDPATGRVLAGVSAEGAAGPGLFASDDGGDTYAEAGLPGERVDALAFDESDEGRVLAGTRTHDGVGGGLLESLDGGDTWSGYGLEGREISDVLVVDGDVLAATEGDGVFVGVRGDEFWHALEDTTVYDLAAGMPTETVYAGTISGLHVSDDRGATWRDASERWGVELPDEPVTAVTALADGRVVFCSGEAVHVYSPAEGVRSRALVPEAAPAPADGPPRAELTGPGAIEGVDAPGAGPVVVYSPHPDDETYALGHSIAALVERGVEVYGVLLTDGDASGVYDRWYLEDEEVQDDLDGDGEAGTRLDFGLLRRAEYVRAMEVLGVDESRLYFWGAADPESGPGMRDKALFVGDVAEVVLEMEERFPGATHVAPMKYLDGDPFGPGDGFLNPNHTVVCDALDWLAETGSVRASFYKAYVYALQPHERWAPHIEFGPLEHGVKVRAMETGFGRVEESEGFFGLGRKSTAALYMSVELDLREYRVEADEF